MLALQEVRLTTDGQKIAEEALKELGWSVVWGKPQPVRPGTVKSVLDAKQGGVGILTKSCHNAVPSPRTRLGEELFETGRWQSVVIQVNKGGTLLHVVTVYGFPRANEGGDEMVANEELLEKVFMEAASLGDVPVFVCGDFNVQVANSHVLSEMVTSGVWSDSAASIAAIEGKEPEVTYTTPVGQRSRIDLIFTNCAATRMLEGCSVLTVPDDGIKRHKPVEVNANVCLKRDFALECHKVRRLPKGQFSIEKEQLEKIAKRAFDRHRDAYDGACLSQDVNALWEAWCCVAEDCLVEKAAVEAGKPDLICDQRYYGRGRCARTHRVRVGKAPDKRGVAVDPERRVLEKLTNLLLEIQTSSERSALWQKIQRLGMQCFSGGQLGPAWKATQAPSNEEILEIQSKVEKVLYKVTWGDRERYIRRWRRRRVERAKNDIGDLAKHFRNPSQAPVAIVKTPDGRITGQISEVDSVLRKSWLPIFAKHSEESNPPPSVAVFLDKYGSTIPNIEPQRLSPLTLEDIKRALGKIGSQGAGGLDGWTPFELRQLPDCVLALLLPMFEIIEKSGEWPELLCWAGITLIPKGEGGEPLNLRPITVTPVVYRVWAAAKMRQCIQWQELWIRRGQHGARAKHSTMNDLIHLSLVFEEAVLEGKPMNGVAINCCSHETLLHFGLQSSHLNICYYHQDLHQELFYSGLRQELHSKPPCPPTHCCIV